MEYTTAECTPQAKLHTFRRQDLALDTLTTESWHWLPSDASSTPHLSSKIGRLQLAGSISPDPQMSPCTYDSQADTPVMEPLQDDWYCTTKMPWSSTDRNFSKTPSFGSSDDTSLRVSSLGSASSEDCRGRMELLAEDDVGMCISCPADFVASRADAASPFSSLVEADSIARDRRQSHRISLHEDTCDGFNVKSVRDIASCRLNQPGLIQRSHSQGEISVIALPMPSSPERKKSRAHSPERAAQYPDPFFKAQRSLPGFQQPQHIVLLKNRSASMSENSNKETGKPLRRCISISAADLQEPEKKLQRVKDSVCTLEDCISTETAGALLRGADHMRRLFDRIVFIDCRYPYEYDGGHIRAPPSLSDWIDVVHIPPHDSQAAMDLLFNCGGSRPLPPVSLGQDRVCIIFHCEFSERRGPDLWRKVRGEDRRRALEQDHYPALFYPEMYVLKSGYKKFFQTYPDLCEPQEYVPEADERFAADCMRFKQACPGSRSRLGKKKSAPRGRGLEVPPLTSD